MVVSKDFIFLHLQKCGGSFIRDFMLQNVPGARKIVPQHDGYTTIRGNKNLPIIGVARNPWDWYVSLYHYHMINVNGSFMKDILIKGGDFKGWLKLFLKKESGRLHDMNFDWVRKHGVGPYTYRFVKCFNNTGLSINKIDDVDVSKVTIVHMENLVPEFISALESHNVNLSYETLEILKNKEKVNTSKHKKYTEYYDDETIELVRQKDKLIIDLFNYEFG